MEDLYNRINFIVSGGALTLLTDFLGNKKLPALILEASKKNDGSFMVMDAAGTAPESLIWSEFDIKSLFSNRPILGAFEVSSAKGSDKWPLVVRVKGAHREIYILLAKEPDDNFINELQPYAGLINLWQTFQNIDDTEKKLSRLSYMLLATKSTLASVFEPMPLQYFAAFLSDVLRESLFPENIVVLKDEGNYLSVVTEGHSEKLPERTGIYAQAILPPVPVITNGTKTPFEVVLPVAEGNCRLFCVMHWNYLPDEQMMNFLELLGNLAVRAIAINNLKTQTNQSASYISSGEFTVLSLSNVLKILKSAKDKAKFLSMLGDIFTEQCRMSDCLLAVWDAKRKGYIIAEKRVGQIKTDLNPALLPSDKPIQAENISEIFYDLKINKADKVFKSWGLAGCPWDEMGKMRYLFPISDDNLLVGMIALASGSNKAEQTQLDKAQIASLHLIAQFAGYEFKRF
ncbi:MAG: hypothetical protein IJM40_03305 [Synergistaceae bacterium]|nr:hypothetical protein [Synergistaceae bacterium]